MGGQKPKPVQTPFQQQQNSANTFGFFSPSGSQEAKAFLETPLNFGGSYGNLNTGIDVDPGVGRRADLAEQEVSNRWDSAFNAGVPSWIRNMNRAKELRDVQAQGAAEAQQANYTQQRGQRDLEFQKAQLMEGANQAKAGMDLMRRERLLPQLVQTGGSGNTSGFNTQIMPGQQGLFGSFLGGLGAGIGGAIPFGKMFS